MHTHTHTHAQRGLCCCRERQEAWQTSPPTTQAFLDQQPRWVPEAGQEGPRCVVSRRGTQPEPGAQSLLWIEGRRRWGPCWSGLIRASRPRAAS